MNIFIARCRGRKWFSLVDLRNFYILQDVLLFIDREQRRVDGIIVDRGIYYLFPKSLKINRRFIIFLRSHNRVNLECRRFLKMINVLLLVAGAGSGVLEGIGPTGYVIPECMSCLDAV